MKKIVCMFAGAFAFVAAPLTANNEKALDQCTTEVFASYFPQPFVDEVLGEYQVEQNLWPEINQKLQEQDRQIVDIVEERASKITPNPLEDSSQRTLAISIFRETLFDSFSKVMKEYGIDDEEQIRAMLDEIQYKKAKAFKKCMEKNSSTLEMQAPEGEDAVEINLDVDPEGE